MAGYRVMKQDTGAMWIDLGLQEADDPMVAIRKAAEAQEDGSGTYRAFSERFMTQRSLSFRTETKVVWEEDQAALDTAASPEATQTLTGDGSGEALPEADPLAGELEGVGVQIRDEREET